MEAILIGLNIYLFYILQFVNTATHMSGHTLDVIMCRATANLIQEVKVGDMIKITIYCYALSTHVLSHATLAEKKIVMRKI